MINLQFPEFPFRVKKENRRSLIFDEFRRLWVKLTPEEWVRQNVLQYLLQVMEYPASLVAVEREFKLGELRKRFDILVFDHQHQPWMMVECKAMTIPLTESVLQQVLRYNIAVPVPYLVITNGIHCAAFTRNNGELHMLEALPAFSK